MPTSLFASRAETRVNDADHSHPDLSLLGTLRSHAQIFRLGHRYAVADLGQSFVYVVSKGVVGLECAPNAEQRTVVELLYPGDILVPGQQAPLPDLALIAKGQVEFWKLAMTSIASEGARQGALWQEIFARLNNQNARSQLHISATLGLNCEQRLAGFLIEIGCRLGVCNSGAVSFELPLSRYSIAEYLSLNADTVSRALSALTASNVIARKGRFQISIIDWNGLLAMCPLGEAIKKLHRVGNFAFAG